MVKCYDCGIDLGTTNSCIVLPVSSEPGYDVVQHQAGAIRTSIIPSAVAFNARGRMYVGPQAVNLSVEKDTARRFKRKMGTESIISFEAAGINKTPEELSAEVLKYLRSAAEKQAGHELRDVVITVPAAFSSLQINATKKAGELAGFKNVLLLQEPIAASIAYGFREDYKGKSWMIFDYGGGTLDVAIISTKDNRLQVINTEGDNYFGGSDIDQIIFNKIVIPTLRENYNVDRLFDETSEAGRRRVNIARNACEICKSELSREQQIVFEIPELEDDDGCSIDFERTVTVNELNELIRPTIDKSISIAKKALEGAKMSADDIDAVLLVGGSTNIPLVRTLLKDAFNTRIECSLDPMEVVGVGAALYAARQELEDEETDALDTTLFSYGDNLPTAKFAIDTETSDDTIDVVGRIDNKSDIDRIKLIVSRTQDFHSPIWDSGWIDFSDNEKGYFSFEDVYLCKNAENYICLIGIDFFGYEIPIKNANRIVRQSGNSLKMNNPTATMSLGLKIEDKNGFDALDILIKKNTPLPAQEIREYRLTKDLDPRIDDSIIIEVYEGENTDNPKANHFAGNISIKSTAMQTMVKRDTVIQITLSEDINRTIAVEGYIPDLEYIIPSKTLMKEDARDLEIKVRLTEKKRDLDQMETAIRELNEKGIDSSDLYEELQNAKKECEGNISDDGEMNQTIKNIENIQTEIAKRTKEMKDSKVNIQMERYKQFYVSEVEAWGDNLDIETIHKKAQQFDAAKDVYSKQMILDDMRNYRWSIVHNKFEPLRNMYINSYETHSHFSNPKRAEVLKQNAREAIEDQDIVSLQKAFDELGAIWLSEEEYNEKKATSDIKR